ncbi:MAG: hypothetical protein HKO70_04100 [Acidimicrobiia bacterium]|nr:hypothetical protein [Acidimicrobiia bacterium]
METSLGITFDALRPETPDHPVDDFLPMDLAEGFSVRVNGIHNTMLENLETRYGTTIGSYFPDSEWMENYDPDRAQALSNRYASVAGSCQSLPANDDIKACMFDVARTLDLQSLFPHAVEKIDAAICLDTQTQASAACPADAYGIPPSALRAGSSGPPTRARA